MSTTGIPRLCNGLPKWALSHPNVVDRCADPTEEEFKFRVLGATSDMRERRERLVRSANAWAARKVPRMVAAR